MMRRIDKWGGLPLCLLANPVCWLLDRMRSARRKAPDLRATLFIELSEMGSAVIVDPAMRKLKAKEGTTLYFAIFQRNYKSLEILKTIPEENVFKMKDQNLFSLLGDVFRFLIWCRKKKISTVIDLELFSRFTALLSFLSGARSRVGFVNLHDEGLYRGNLVNFGVRYNPHVHVSVNFVSLVNRAMALFNNAYATVPVSRSELRLEMAEVSPVDVESVREKIRRFYPAWRDERIVLLNVNASDMLPQRRWPRENFAEVAKGLLRESGDLLILLTGAGSESSYVQQVTDLVSSEKCINTAGVFQFHELVPLYSVSECMLTNDSGPAHFAAVTPLKVFVLFGPETPNLYLPLGNAEAIYLGFPCSPCVSAGNHRKTACLPRPCITMIEPLLVFEKLKRYLAKKPVYDSLTR